MSKVERSIHVGIGHTPEELWILFSQFLHGAMGFLGRTVDLPDFIIFPDLLVTFLDCNGGIALFCLLGHQNERQAVLLPP